METNPTTLNFFSWRSRRLFICLLLMFVLCMTVSNRSDLSMAMVCMVNATAYAPKEIITSSNLTYGCGSRILDDEFLKSSGYTGTILWTPQMQSLLFSASYYGSLLTTSFSGYIADRYGPKVVVSVVILNCAIVSLLSPTLAQWSFAAFVIIRITIGLGEGFTTPALSVAVSRWFSRAEKSSVAAIYTSGNQLAMIITAVVSAQLCDSTFGWPSIFYLFGCCTFVCFIIWIVFFTDHPSSNRWISEEEKHYITENTPIKRTTKSINIPWRALATSWSLYSIFFCQFSFSMQASIIQSFLPTFLKEQLNIPLHQNGIYTTVTFIVQLFFKSSLGIIADILKRKGLISHTNCCKLFQFIASIGCATMLMALSYFPTCESPITALFILGLHGFFFSFAVGGFFTSLLSVAPEYIGTLNSITMVFGHMANILGMQIAGFLSVYVPQHKWISIFGVCSVLCILSGIVFLFKGTAEKQNWGQNKVGSTSSISDNVQKQSVQC